MAKMQGFTIDQMAAFAWLGWCYWAFQRVRPGEDSQPAFDRLEDALDDVERIGAYPSPEYVRPCPCLPPDEPDPNCPIPGHGKAKAVTQ